MAVEPARGHADRRREQVGVAEPVPQVGTPARAEARGEPLARRLVPLHPEQGRRVAGVVFVALVLFCLIWPMISPYDPNEVDFANKNAPPSLEHPFGTDSFGRDLFTRAALGGRVSIGIGFAATFVILLIGVATARSPASSAAGSTTR